MANFTSRDSIPFTPYIETNPVDAYLKVGMYKESQLQAGIQKVQQQVDTLVGLPIDKEVDKQYLQNKLGELKTGISKNLSGDFSDARITNQIAGAAKQVYSDPVVQNSVQGTMSKQKGLADIEQAKKDGKWNIANETVFQDQVAAWYNDGVVGSKSSQYFTGYTPYTDIMAEFKKAWADTNPGEDIPNDAFYYKDGVQHINPVIFKGKGPKQIQAVWNLVKQNGNVQQQLGIDGKYQFRGQPVENIYAQLGQTTKANIDANNKTILALQAKAATGDMEAAAHVEDLKQMNVEAENSLAQYADALKANPDAVKTAIVSQQRLSNLINAYSYQTMEKSPLWETSFEQNKFDVQTRQWEKTFDQNERQFAWRQYMDKAKYDQDERKKKDEAGNPIISLAAANPLETVKDENTARMAIVGAQDNYTQAVRETAYTMALDGGTPPPFYKDPLTNRWEPNVGHGRPYETEAVANGVTQQLMSVAKDGYINGTLKGHINDLMEQSEAKYKNLKVAEQRVADVETMFAPQISQLSTSLKEEAGGNPALAQDFVKAYIVDNELPGWKATQAGLRQKYGTDWKQGMGIKEFPQSGGTGGAGIDPRTTINGQHLIQYQKAASKLKNTPSLTATVMAKDQEYQRRQTTELGFEVTRPVIDSKTREQANLEFASIASVVKDLNPGSNKGEYNDFLSLLDKGGKGWEGNIYKTYINPITGAGSLTIMRGSDVLSIPVPAEEILRKYPEQRVNSAFTEKFQPSLDLNRGIATGEGYADAFKANQPSTSPYIVKYHVLSTGNGTYRLKWWAGVKPTQGEPSPSMLINGEVMGEKYGLPQDMSEEQIMATINQMKDKTWVEKTITLDQKLKQAVKQ